MPFRGCGVRLMRKSCGTPLPSYIGVGRSYLCCAWCVNQQQPYCLDRATVVRDTVLSSAGSDDDRTLSRRRGLWSDLIDAAIAAHHGLCAENLNPHIR